MSTNGVQNIEFVERLSAVDVGTMATDTALATLSKLFFF
jgi:hypothetical protein